ncbi:MAG TPA: heme ABC exporter ATP-binding protein CcmA [Azospirillaceae bacterium]|nr:heme ABC exporter ATP-binding protein CcmA [Azospirillaceae bacterium]
MSLFTGTALTCLRGERVVFAGLDFRVARGGCLVLTGPNGSGKSSLLRIMAGLLKPFAGTLAWEGVDVRAEPELHGARLHYVGHLDAVKPAFTVAETLLHWTRLRDPAGAEARVQAALERLGIAHLAEVPGRFLSAGQKRRSNLARLLASPAPLWLLDEPTVALDRAAVAMLEGEIARHRAEGGAVVLSTHMDMHLDAPDRLDLAEFTPQLGDIVEEEEA